MISQHTSKLMYTLKIKDQDILKQDTTLIQNTAKDLSNLSKPTTPIIGSDFAIEHKTSGKQPKQEYALDHKSAGGSYQTLSIPTTFFTNKRPASLSLSQQLPQHFSSFLPAPTPQIIQPQWKDNRKILTSLLANPRQKHRGLTSSITLTVLSKETLHSYSMETGTRPASSL